MQQKKSAPQSSQRSQVLSYKWCWNLASDLMYTTLLQRECRNHISKQQPSDAISVLAEGQSLQCYKRMRLSQPFETPQQKRERAQITPVQQPKHSPKFENVQWDTDKLLDRLHNWPSEQKINWTEIGREFNIPGKNKGQVVKEFAREHGVGVCQLDHRPHNKRLRARKLRMPGGDISVPHSLYCVLDWDAAFVLPAPLAFFLVCRLAESRGGGLQQRQFQTHFQLKIADSSETLVALQRGRSKEGKGCKCTPTFFPGGALHPHFSRRKIIYLVK